ncbi:MAG: histidine phosphatase family protein [Dehalococcoidia bacterium]
MPPPPAIIIVRHGQSEHHVRGLTGGWTDTPLTALGHEQARLVAARLLAELPSTPVHVFASDLMRAAQTASHIAAALGVDVQPDGRLREHNNGDSANMTMAAARERFPDARDMRMHTQMLPGAETGAQFYKRARSFLEELDDSSALPILVTHGGTIRMLVAAWLGFTEDALDYAHFASLPTGITVLRSYGDAAREHMLERLSDIAHLTGTEGWVNLRDAIA